MADMGEAASSSRNAPPRVDRDAPLDAIASANAASQGASPSVGPMPSRALAPEWYSGVPTPKVYAVPKRFGLLAILVITTVMGVLFGGLRLHDAPPSLFLLLGLMALAICLVQMFYGKDPRRASVITGAILSPLIYVPVAIYEGHPLPLIFGLAISYVFLGGFAGYLMGACAAGIFLVLERVEPHLPGGRTTGATGDQSIWGEFPGGSDERQAT